MAAVSQRRAARERWREQARALIGRGPGWVTDDVHPCTRFDVLQVRAYCERLVGEGESLADERVAFVAWTETRGLGLLQRESGWPRSLAVEWAASSGPAMLPRRRDAVLGDSIARTARRLLDTLDGRCPWAPSALAQASECWGCTGHGETGPSLPAGPETWVARVSGPGVLVVGDDGNSREAEIGEHVRAQCPTCRGTGHNLAGVLPELEHPQDQRVVPRGQHRIGTPDEPPGAITGMRASVTAAGYEAGELIRVRGYGVGRWAPRSSAPERRAAGLDRYGLMPRWRRGEIKTEIKNIEGPT
jgi:hypothetical protein